MAFPVLIGIPALISGIGALASGIVGTVVAWLTYKTAKGAIFAALALVVTVSFFAGISIISDEVIGYIGAYSVGQFSLYILPPSLPYAVGVAISVDVARLVHDVSHAQIGRQLRLI